MLECRTQVREGGRIVIPSLIRRELSIETGDELVLKVDQGEIHVLTLKHAISHAQKLIEKYNPENKCLTEELFHLRKEESDND